MKKLIYFCFILVLFSSQNIYSQIELDTVVIKSHHQNVKMELNNKTTILGSQEGDVSHLNQIKKPALRYYYFPNLNAYYDLKNAKYIYKVSNEWVVRDNIPSNYRGYSIYNNYRVQIEGYTGDEPYDLIKEHQKLYPADYTGKLRKIALLKQQEKEKQQQKALAIK